MRIPVSARAGAGGGGGIHVVVGAAVEEGGVEVSLRVGEGA